MRAAPIRTACRAATARASILTRPVGDRIVFAGEHTEQSAYGTLHGAHLSGIRAAAEARRLLGEARPWATCSTTTCPRATATSAA